MCGWVWISPFCRPTSAAPLFSLTLSSRSAFFVEVLPSFAFLGVSLTPGCREMPFLSDFFPKPRSSFSPYDVVALPTAPAPLSHATFRAIDSILPERGRVSFLLTLRPTPSPSFACQCPIDGTVRGPRFLSLDWQLHQQVSFLPCCINLRFSFLKTCHPSFVRRGNDPFFFFLSEDGVFPFS